MAKNDIEDRLIDFSVRFIKIYRALIPGLASDVLGGQGIRSASSTALNYGEAQSAESPRDFLHKMKVVLKELRETLICLKIIERAELCKMKELLPDMLQENDELIRIFVKSIQTARANAGIK